MRKFYSYLIDYIKENWNVIISCMLRTTSTDLREFLTTLLAKQVGVPNIVVLDQC